MKWIIWTFFKNGFTPTLFLCLKMVLQLAPRLKNNAFKMRVHFEWLLLWIHKKICLQKSQGVHVMFYRALTGQGQQSCSQVWILTVRYGYSDMAWSGVLVCCCRLHWHCTWMEAKCQGRREDISAASSYVHRTFWKERKGGIEWYMRGCDWGFFMTEKVPLRHGHWTLAALATAE